MPHRAALEAEFETLTLDPTPLLSEGHGGRLLDLMWQRVPGEPGEVCEGIGSCFRPMAADLVESIAKCGAAANCATCWCLRDAGAGAELLLKGRSAGAAAAVGVKLLEAGEQVDDAVILAAVDAHGRLIDVDGVPEKLAAAAQHHKLRRCLVASSCDQITHQIEATHRDAEIIYADTVEEAFELVSPGAVARAYLAGLRKLGEDRTEGGLRVRKAYVPLRVVRGHGKSIDALALTPHPQDHLIGGPGAGKTVLLKMLACTAAKLPWPLYLRLPEVFAEGGTPAQEFDEYLKRSFERRQLAWLIDRYRTGEVWLLADGLDELPPGRGGPRDRVERWLAEQPGPVLVSSRPGLELPGFRTIELDDLDRDTAALLVRQSGETMDRLWTLFRSWRQRSRMVSAPYYITLLVRAARSHPDPDRAPRLELLQTAFLDSLGGEERAQEWSAAFSQLCWRMFEKQPSRPHLFRADALDLLRSCDQRPATLRQRAQDSPMEKAQELLRELLENRVLEAIGGTVQPPHRVIADFFAAQWIIAQPDPRSLLDRLPPLALVDGLGCFEFIAARHQSPGPLLDWLLRPRPYLVPDDHALVRMSIVDHLHVVAFHSPNGLSPTARQAWSAIDLSVEARRAAAGSVPAEALELLTRLHGQTWPRPIFPWELRVPMSDLPRSKTDPNSFDLSLLYQVSRH